jgi:hypothetical protein
MMHTLHFFSSKCRLFHTATFFGSCIIHILHTDVLKFKYKTLVSKGQNDGHIHVIKTNSMHNLSSVNFVSQPLHVSSVFVAHHQEVYSVYIQQLVNS